MQHFIKSLKAGGRAAVVIKNTFLSNMDNADIAMRKLLLETCNLHTILDLPAKTFQGAGVKTVVLFFEKGAPTKNIWHYQLDVGRSLGKTKPLNDDDLQDFVRRQSKFEDSPISWSTPISQINKNTWDLMPVNPNKVNVTELRSPIEILEEISIIDKEIAADLDEIRKLL